MFGFFSASPVTRLQYSLRAAPKLTQRLLANSDINNASTAASSPLPTTATTAFLKKGPSQVTQ